MCRFFWAVVASSAPTPQPRSRIFLIGPLTSRRRGGCRFHVAHALRLPLLCCVGRAAAGNGRELADILKDINKLPSAEVPELALGLQVSSRSLHPHSLPRCVNLFLSCPTLTCDSALEQSNLGQRHHLKEGDRDDEYVVETKHEEIASMWEGCIDVHMSWVGVSRPSIQARSSLTMHRVAMPAKRCARIGFWCVRALGGTEAPCRARAIGRARFETERHAHRWHGAQHSEQQLWRFTVSSQTGDVCKRERAMEAHRCSC